MEGIGRREVRKCWRGKKGKDGDGVILSHLKLKI